MRKTIAAMLAVVALAGCSPDLEVSPDTEWLAATSGERDAEKVQLLLNDVHKALGVETGPAADEMSAQVLKSRRDTAIVPHLECVLAVAQREGGGNLADISGRCNDDWTIRFND